MKNNGLEKKLKTGVNVFPLIFLLFAVLVTWLLSPGQSFAKFISEAKGRDAAAVAKPVLFVESLNDEIYVENDGGSYRFSVSNFSGEEVSQTSLVFYISITLPENSGAVPGVLRAASNSAYTDSAVLLTAASSINGNVYIYRHSSMAFGLNGKTVYYDLTFEGISAGENIIQVDICAEQSDN